MSKHIREELANYAHDAWSGWMKYLFEKSKQNDDGTVTIPVWAVERWKKQMNTPYEALSEGEKDSDRDEADKMTDIVRPYNEKHKAEHPQPCDCPDCFERLLKFFDPSRK